MAVPSFRLLLMLLACGLVAACSPTQSQPSVGKIALLAPFEGRYRDIGYEALHAARLAFNDYADLSLDLLPLDDGGSAASAQDRALALRQDPSVQAVLLLGNDATSPHVQDALEGLPSIIIGYWGNAPQATSFALSHSEVDERISWTASLSELSNAAMPLAAGEVLSLPQVQLLRDDLSGITIVSSGSLPTDDFRQRYQGNDPFAPEPSLLATLTYDATALLIESLHTDQLLDTITFDGLNGSIRFENGYWADAPLSRYQYNDTGDLIQLD